MADFQPQVFVGNPRLDGVCPQTPSALSLLEGEPLWSFLQRSSPQQDLRPNLVPPQTAEAKRAKDRSFSAELGVCYLSLCDAVDDGLQGLLRVTLEDPLHAAGSGSQGLLHRHVQLVVVFLSCQVLENRKETTP